MRNSSNEPVFVAELSLIKKVSNLYDVTLIVNTKDDFEHGNDNRELLNYIGIQFPTPVVRINFRNITNTDVFLNFKNTSHEFVNIDEEDKPTQAITNNSIDFKPTLAITNNSIDFIPKSKNQNIVEPTIINTLNELFGAIVTE